MTVEKDIILKRPSIWRLEDKEKLDLRDKVNEAVLNLFLQITPKLSDLVDKGKGRETVSQYVPGRPEDEMLRIDQVAENSAIEILENAARELGFSMFVFSEHENFKVGDGEPEVIGCLDPFDNSDEHKKGLDTPPHFVFAVYNLDGNPIAAGDSNLFTRHIFINRDGKNYLYNLRTSRLTEIPQPTKIESMQDERFVIASYFGRYEYSSKFNSHFEQLNKDRFRKSTFHGKGGAHIYAYMATGAVSAYIMFDEPRGEIDPGLPFALTAGYSVVSVNSDGSFENYKFDPKLQHETVPLFIAASTPLLRDEIIDYYLISQTSF